MDFILTQSQDADRPDNSSQRAGSSCNIQVVVIVAKNISSQLKISELISYHPNSSKILVSA